MVQGLNTVYLYPVSVYTEDVFCLPEMNLQAKQAEAEVQKKLTQQVAKARQALPNALKELDHVKAELLKQKLQEVGREMQTEGEKLRCQVRLSGSCPFAADW